MPILMCLQDLNLNFRALLKCEKMRDLGFYCRTSCLFRNEKVPDLASILQCVELLL